MTDFNTIPESILNMTIERFLYKAGTKSNVQFRVAQALKNSIYNRIAKPITTVRELVQVTERDLFCTPNMGKVSRKAIHHALSFFNISLSDGEYKNCKVESKKEISYEDETIQPGYPYPSMDILENDILTFFDMYGDGSDAMLKAQMTLYELSRRAPPANKRPIQIIRDLYDYSIRDLALMGKMNRITKDAMHNTFKKMGIRLRLYGDFYFPPQLLCLYESIEIDGYRTLIRVPGGWLCENSEFKSTCFIPYSNHNDYHKNSKAVEQ